MWAAGVIAFLFVAVVVGGGWYFATEIRRGAFDVEPEAEVDYDLRLLAADEEAVTLEVPADPPADLLAPGTWGLQWEGGYGRVGGILEADDERVVRAFAVLSGRPPEAGAPAHLDPFAYFGDPHTALGLPFEEVRYQSDIGEFPAWLVAAGGDTWAILAHGKGASRMETLRILPTLAAHEVTALAITYRNDPGTPLDPSGRYGHGSTEWRDLEGAVRYAQEHGARRLLLIGYSMGGAVVISFLYESPLAAEVSGVILDSPELDLGGAIDVRAGDERLPVVGLRVPMVITAAAKLLAELRFGIDFDDFDHLRRADLLATPVLLFQGSADDSLPPALADALAAARPDLVTYRPVEGAGHVRAWNNDPAAYESAVGDFVRSLRG